MTVRKVPNMTGWDSVMECLPCLVPDSLTQVVSALCYQLEIQLCLPATATAAATFCLSDGQAPPVALMKIQLNLGDVLRYTFPPRNRNTDVFARFFGGERHRGRSLVLCTVVWRSDRVVIKRRPFNHGRRKGR